MNCFFGVIFLEELNYSRDACGVGALSMCRELAKNNLKVWV